MKNRKIYTFYFFPIMYVIFGGIIATGFGLAIILDCYVYNDLKLIKSECITLCIFLLAVLYGLFLILRDKVQFNGVKCIEKLYNRTVKEITTDKIKRIIIIRTPFRLKGGVVKRKSIIIDDGTFQEENLPINCFHYCPQNVSWILLDYSEKRLKNLKSVLSKIPIEWKI